MSGAPPLPDGMVRRLRALYDAQGRAYHAWTHVEALDALLGPGGPPLHDPDTVRLAIPFHDAILDPTRRDNEARSADLAADWLAGLVPPRRVGAVRRAILATCGHRVPPGVGPDEASDIAHFLDMDLSILGAGTEAFDAYEAGIRTEYAHVPKPAYRIGRAAVLRGFRDRDPLYLTAWGRDRFSAPARANLAGLVRTLEAA